MNLIFGDAFGQEIFDAFMGKPQEEIIERDDGLIAVSGRTMDYLLSFAKWHPAEGKAMRFVRGRVLDIGCGGGRHSLYLQDKGLDVVGIDNSPLAVEVCRRRGLKDVRLLPLAQINSSLGKFDTILMLGNNFGLMESYFRAKQLLKRFYRLTTASARIIAQTRDPYNTDNPDHLAYHKLNKSRGRMGGQTRIRVRYKRVVSPWFDYLLVSKTEMKDILSNTGWKGKKYLESDGSPVYVAIIQKTA